MRMRERKVREESGIRQERKGGMKFKRIGSSPGQKASKGGPGDRRASATVSGVFKKKKRNWSKVLGGGFPSGRGEGVRISEFTFGIKEKVAGDCDRVNDTAF
jgi:hypothetical protein